MAISLKIYSAEHESHQSRNMMVLKELKSIQVEENKYLKKGVWCHLSPPLGSFRFVDSEALVPFTLKIFRGSWSRCRCGGRSWTDLIPRTHQVYSYVWNNVLRKKKKTKNWWSDRFTSGNKRETTSKQAVKAETPSRHKLHPQQSHP